MITLYTWATPNGRKASIMLEEIGLAYTAVPVNIGQDEQFDPEFLEISPNNKIPAIVDEEGVDRRQTVFETAAILTYLAEKTGHLLARHGPRRVETLEWLAWSVSGLAPMAGQWNYFARRASEPVPAAIERFGKELGRLFGVLERRLSHGSYLAGDYSIADISTYTWTKAVLAAFKETTPGALGPTPHLDRWLSEMDARPAVIRGMQVPQV
jgi:GST-like protein